MNPAPSSSDTRNVDPREVERFSRIASDWWDPNGKFRPLHRLNPARLTYIRDRLREHFGLEAGTGHCLEGLSIVDIGCGGGLLCEPLRRLGAGVTGIDPAGDAIEVARRHAEGERLEIEYLDQTVEDLIAGERRFDAVLCLEVVEHVPDVPRFVQLCAGLLRPGGLFVLSTINRTLKSYALAIVGAEYVLRLLPVGTHRWDRFVTTRELSSALDGAGLRRGDLTGLIFDPLRGEWRTGRDTDVNYFMTAIRPEQ